MLPNVSIILPVRNECKNISLVLNAVLNQDYLGSLELLVVDGMSTDNTRDIIRSFQQSHPTLILIDNPQKIVPTGINLALQVVKGEIIIRVDGHCVIAPNYVSNCVKNLIDEGVDGVGGPMKTIGETPLSETIALAMSSTFGVGNSAFRTSKDKTTFTDTVPFPAYTKAIIQKVGLYDEELVRNQDDEFNYRIREGGGRILLAADVQSKYFSRGSLRKLGKQFFQYGLYKVRVLQKHPRQMSVRQFIPPVFVLALFAAVILTVLVSWGWSVLVWITGSYLVANLASSGWIANKNGWKYLPVLPVCFAILHLSYGTGFLAGLVKFWNRWGDKKGKVPEHKM